MAHRFTAVVVGTGFIGPVHVEGLQRAGVQVAGMVGSTPEKSKIAAKTNGLPRGYDSLDEVLADDSVDCVHLATPNRFHFEQAAAVLRAGKHVVCEKPLAMNSTESKELVRLAAESGKAAAVAYNIRFYPLCHEAAARANDGSLGELLHVTGSYVQDWLLRETDFNWRVVAEDGGELRAVADIGTHWLDLIQFISGHKIVAVCADLRTIHPQRQRPVGGIETFSGSANSGPNSGPNSAPNSASEAATVAVDIDTEDCGSVMLRFDNGANGSLWVSQTTAGRKNCLRFEMAGANQSMAWNSEQPNSMWLGNRDVANETLLRDPGLLGNAAARITNYPGGHNEGFPDTWKQFFRTFYGHIAANDDSAPPYPTFEDGHREILLCEAILQSHRQRSWIDVPGSTP
jgi:predicted dehydrogenase